jgi:predicted dehydrogenase
MTDLPKLRIGILGPSEIAIRRFMPALAKVAGLEFAGVAVASSQERAASGASESNDTPRNVPYPLSDSIVEASQKKASVFAERYGGNIYPGYEALIHDDTVDVIYVPLPPALHFIWGKAVLNAGKHLFLEKPFTTRLDNTQSLLALARKQNLTVHENYMFEYHSQISWLIDFIHNREIGDIRLIRIDFGFPFRGASDFRYSKSLGGGALLDCGGYTVKLATLLLGPTTQLVTSQLNCVDGFEVDLFGSASLKNDDGLVAQVSFGMSNDYRCSIDVWGSTGSVLSKRILTAQPGFSPTMLVSHNGETREIELDEDDSFKNSIEYFLRCIDDSNLRRASYASIEFQASLVEGFLAGFRC